MIKLLNIIQFKIASGHERSIRAKKNIIASFFIKGASIVIGFLIVRITIDYLDTEKYGIWLTLTSFFTWFAFFELGLGNGLRNKLAEALAMQDYRLGKIYVSTTYASLTLIIGFVALVFFLLNNFIDWTIILNTNKALKTELSKLAQIVFGFFFIRFIVKLIGTVLYADQRPAMANALNPLSNLLSLVFIYLLTKYTKGSLIYLGWIMSVTPVAVLLGATFFFYGGKYKLIAPSLKYIKLKYAKSLLTLGAKFFLIQVSGLIMFQSSNIIIAQFLGPKEVTVYNVAYKYFSILIMVFSVITTPFWSAYTEAWVNKDIKWIKNTINKLLNIWMLLGGVGVLMLVFSPFFYHLWLGNRVVVPFKLSFVLLLYFITYTFGGIFNMFINGVGKIKLQVISSFVGSLLFVFSAIIFIKFFGLGVIGLVVASILANFNGYILTPIQYKKLITGTASGIWDK